MAQAWIDHHARDETVALVASTNEHVDAINRRVQVVRGAAGHLAPDRGTRIAGGEMAWVGDIVATRRNDRRLVTTTGEQVRNRDTWTVTAIHADGAITVTQQQGHGTLTLPADYVRQHVRLGYAATEHGYQSETATISICLASPITTRRGLYVAAIRGRDQNIIRVITDTDDVAEARAILEGVLASDRADIPAVTQRHTLAAQDRRPARPAPPLTPRCEIPDWFDGLLAGARADLARRRGQEASARAQRVALAGELADADMMLQHVDAETDPDRYVLALAEQRAQQARQTHTAAIDERHQVSWRQRRATREVVAATEHRARSTDTRLERTRSSTAGSVERYQRALDEQRERRNRLDDPRPRSANPQRLAGNRHGPASSTSPRDVAAMGIRRRDPHRPAHRHSDLPHQHSMGRQRPSRAEAWPGTRTLATAGSRSTQGDEHPANARATPLTPTTHASTRLGPGRSSEFDRKTPAPPPRDVSVAAARRAVRPRRGDDAAAPNGPRHTPIRRPNDHRTNVK